MFKVLKAAAAMAALSGLASAASAQVLYSQAPHTPGAAGANGLSGFQGLLAGVQYDREVGDDFTVPAAGWTINKVKSNWVQFTNGDPNAVTGADIQFYTIAGGVVGSAVATATVLNTTVVDGPGVYFTRTEKIVSFDITPVILSAGTYFIKVNPIVDHNWFWLTAGSVTNTASQIQRGPLTAAGTDVTWPAAWQQTGPANPIFTTPWDTAFTLEGTVGGGGPSGACCLADGSCVVTTSSGCASLSGIYRGDGSVCATANCPQPATGACCFATGCQVLTQAQCTAQGGTYRGDNSPCATANCPITAWPETGDAGDLPGTAQVVTGSGSLTAIQGSASGSDTDMFQINICTPASFGASTVGGATWDTQLWLFKADGTGVTCNDDAGGGLQSVLTSAFTASLPAGNYYLAINAYNNDARDATNQFLWNTNTPESQPDGPGAANPVANWSGGGTGGAYTIALQGSCFVGGAACYANCDGSTVSPVLNVNDFICFQTKYAAADPYANCDGSTTPPVLNVNDFICFQTRYAAGCP